MQTPKPKVSVLMPVYQTPESYLRAAIESILSQTFTDFEFLILDDCPSKPVESIVKSYTDKRITYIKNKKNIGISASRNKLIDLSKGVYLAVMDHDDIALPKRFAKEVAFLDTHPKVGVVGSWYEVFPKKKVKKKFVTNSQIENDLMFACAILHPSAMLRKSVLEDTGVRYEEQFTPAEDYALWCRLIGKTEFANIPEVLQKYRNYANNTSKLKAAEMQNATDKIRRELMHEHAALMRNATKTETIKIFGIPIITKKKHGGMTKYKLFGFLKINKQNRIDLTE